MVVPPQSRYIRKHVIVAGGSGYIGKCVVSRLRAMGCQVTVLGRNPYNPDNDSGIRHISWSLENQLPEDLFAATQNLPAADAVIYLSHDWNTRGKVDEDTNRRAFRRLLSAARLRGGVRLVVASTV